MAKEKRHKIWNKTDRPQTPWEIKKEVVKNYQEFCHEERLKMKAAGYKGKAVKRGPIQSMGQEGFLLVVNEMS